MEKVGIFSPDAFESISKEQEKELTSGCERPKLTYFPEEDNFFTEYYNIMSKNKGPFPDYYAAGAIDLLSIVSDKKIFTPVEYGKLYPNIWTFRLGVSSLSHKSVSMRPEKILAHDVMPNCSWPGSFSSIGLFQAVATTQRGYMLRDEAGSILNTINTNSEARNLRDFFCELYENDRIDPRVLALKISKKKEEPIQNQWHIDNPYSTLAWATTPNTFQRTTTVADELSGFLLRFIYFSPNFNRNVPPLDTMREGFDIEFIGLRNDLNKIKEKVEQLRDTKLTMSFSAKAAWQAWQKRNIVEIEKERNERLGGIFQRHVTIPLKLAMLYTIGSKEFLEHSGGPYEMKDEHILTAIKQEETYILQHSYETLKLVGTGAVLNRIEHVEALLSANGGSMKLRDIYRIT